MWYFLVIFNTKITKNNKIIITIITSIIVVIIVTWFCNTRKNVVIDVQKKVQISRWGEGGEEVIWPERKHYFLQEMFPKSQM